jgi:hypothetical protein
MKPHLLRLAAQAAAYGAGEQPKQTIDDLSSEISSYYHTLIESLKSKGVNIQIVCTSDSEDRRPQ